MMNVEADCMISVPPGDVWDVVHFKNGFHSVREMAIKNLQSLFGMPR